MSKVSLKASNLEKTYRNPSDLEKAIETIIDAKTKKYKLMIDESGSVFRPGLFRRLIEFFKGVFSFLGCQNHTNANWIDRSIQVISNFGREKWKSNLALLEKIDRVSVQTHVRSATLPSSSPAPLPAPQETAASTQQAAQIVLYSLTPPVATAEPLSRTPPPVEKPSTPKPISAPNSPRSPNVIAETIAEPTIEKPVEVPPVTVAVINMPTPPPVTTPSAPPSPQPSVPVAPAPSLFKVEHIVPSTKEDNKALVSTAVKIAGAVLLGLGAALLGSRFFGKSVENDHSPHANNLVLPPEPTPISNGTSSLPFRDMQDREVCEWILPLRQTPPPKKEMSIDIETLIPNSTPQVPETLNKILAESPIQTDLTVFVPDLQPPTDTALPATVASPGPELLPVASAVTHPSASVIPALDLTDSLLIPKIPNPSHAQPSSPPTTHPTNPTTIASQKNLASPISLSLRPYAPILESVASASLPAIKFTASTSWSVFKSTTSISLSLTSMISGMSKKIAICLLLLHFLKKQLINEDSEKKFFNFLKSKFNIKKTLDSSKNTAAKQAIENSSDASKTTSSTNNGKPEKPEGCVEKIERYFYRIDAAYKIALSKLMISYLMRKKFPNIDKNIRNQILKKANSELTKTDHHLLINGSPFEEYSKCVVTFIEGEILKKPKVQSPQSASTLPTNQPQPNPKKPQSNPKKQSKPNTSSESKEPKHEWAKQN